MSIELSLLGQILDMSRDPEVNLEEFGEKVATSPNLSVEVVRISNSALYGMEGKINRLERAVLILGIRTVASIASGILVGEKIKGTSIGGLSGDQIWMHSLETGVCAQLAARCLGMPMESEAYLAGLLHELGIVDLHAEHGENYAKLLMRAGEEGLDLSTLEQDAFGESHARRILTLARAWGFPAVLQQAVGYHHDPAECPDLSRPLANLVHAAHIIVEEPAEGWSDYLRSDQDEAKLEAFGLTADDVADIREELRERMKEVAEAYA